MFFGRRKKNCGDADADSLFVAVTFDDLARAKRLVVDCGVDPNTQDNYGNTPLHFAIENCHVNVVRVLLDHGADPTIRDNKGRTPLDIGSECSEEFREMLRRRSGGTKVYE